MAIDPRDLEPGADLVPSTKKTTLPTVHILDKTENLNGTNDLKQVRNIRMTVVNILTERFDPTNEKGTDLLLKVLKDADAAALGSLRIQLEEKNNDKAEAMNQLAGALLANLSNPNSQSVLPVVIESKGRPIPVLPDDIETRPFVEGEGAQGTVNQTFEEFTKNANVKLANVSKSDDVKEDVIADMGD